MAAVETKKRRAEAEDGVALVAGGAESKEKTAPKKGKKETKKTKKDKGKGKKKKKAATEHLSEEDKRAVERIKQAMGALFEAPSVGLTNWAYLILPMNAAFAAMYGGTKELRLYVQYFCQIGSAPPSSTLSFHFCLIYFLPWADTGPSATRR
jgi:hypothetical protein